jgi:hypothetical protein
VRLPPKDNDMSKMAPGGRLATVTLLMTLSLLVLGGPMFAVGGGGQKAAQAPPGSRPSAICLTSDDDPPHLDRACRVPGGFRE